jgi:hypothetical protein
MRNKAREITARSTERCDDETQNTFFGEYVPIQPQELRLITTVVLRTGKMGKGKPNNPQGAHGKKR